MSQKNTTLTRLFEIAAQSPYKMIVSCILSAIGTLAGMVPYISIYFITRSLLLASGVANSELRYELLFWAAIAAVSIIVNMLFSFAGSFSAHRLAFKLLYNIRISVMEHIGKLNLGFLSETTTGNIQKTMDDSIEKIEIFIAHLLPDIVGSACALIALLIGLGSLNIWLVSAVILTVVGACILQLSVWGGNRGREILTGVASVSGNMTGAFSEFVNGIAEVKLFGLAGTVTRNLSDTTRKYSKWEVRLYKRVAPFYEGYKTIILSLLAVVLPVGTLLIYLNPGDKTILLSVVMAIIITPAICSPLLELVNYGTRMGEITVALQKIDEILNIEPVPTPQNRITPKSFDVEFQNVTFSYQDISNPLHKLALQNVSFTAAQKQMTALVGPSGGGKTTAGHLVSRFWDVTRGKISIGGVDLRDIAPEDLMELVSFVFQDTYLFADTIYGNITMNRYLEMNAVISAAKSACCHNFIMELPQQYKTVIGSGGMGLSGGESQRIAIARAILKDSPIVILDEALAFSDAENENLIQTAIEELIKDKTVIIIAHRLQSIQNSDQIIVLDKGEVYEKGTHRELMKENGLYRELWSLQNEADSWKLGQTTNIGVEST